MFGNNEDNYGFTAEMVDGKMICFIYFLQYDYYNCPESFYSRIVSVSVAVV